MGEVVVIDINGVLGEVSKTRPPSGRLPDAVLPSGQKFYMNPEAQAFLDTLRGRGHTLVLWTSRLRKNAAPIEALLHGQFEMRLHGEDCRRYAGSFHPVKSAKTLRRLLGGYFRDSQVVFVDDSPQYIELDAKSRVLQCATYTAAADNRENLSIILNTLAK